MNNILGFPGIFRGAVDANVKKISTEMLVAAARAIASAAAPDELVPSPLDKEVHKKVAQVVVRMAMQQGLNRESLTGYFD